MSDQLENGERAWLGLVSAAGRSADWGLWVTPSEEKDENWECNKHRASIRVTLKKHILILLYPIDSDRLHHSYQSVTPHRHLQLTANFQLILLYFSSPWWTQTIRYGGHYFWYYYPSVSWMTCLYLIHSTFCLLFTPIWDYLCENVVAQLWRSQCSGLYHDMCGRCNQRLTPAWKVNWCRLSCLEISCAVVLHQWLMCHTAFSLHVEDAALFHYLHDMLLEKVLAHTPHQPQRAVHITQTVSVRFFAGSLLD